MISDTLIKIAKVLHDYAELLTWPLVALVAILAYRDIIRSLLPGAKVKLTISGITLETTLPVIESSITESLHGEELKEEQWAWLRKLRNQGRTAFCQGDLQWLRPLRDSALIRAYPRGFLQSATAVEITTLGKLLVDASSRK
ncbi:MAG: hypothetical protein WB444_13080 [Gallionella sp.]